jgi:hypothetical protein
MLVCISNYGKITVVSRRPNPDGLGVERAAARTNSGAVGRETCESLRSATMAYQMGTF